MRLRILFFLLFTLAVLFVSGGLLTGCGGSSDNSAATNAGNAGTGRAQLTIRWPDRSSSRLIPFAANSIRVRLTNGNRLLGDSLLVRPANGGTATTTFDRLTVGPMTVEATAYPNSDGSGVAQATAQTTSAVVAGQTVEIRLTLASTITKVEVTPAAVTLDKEQSATLTATAKNAAGEIVLTNSSTISWASKNPAAATVAAGGQVTAVATGTAIIEATETESSKVGAATITVPGPFVPPTFQAPKTYTLPWSLDSVVAGDFDGDGKADAVVNGNNAVYILYGKGDGTLEQPVVLFTWNGAGIGTRAAADMDGDGKLDLLCGADDKVIILRSLGNRAYAAPVGFTIGNSPGSIAVGDFDRDGRLDVVAATPGASLGGDVNVVLNRSTPGNLAFTAPSRLGVFIWSSAVSVADWNGDGRLDIAATYGSDIVGRSGVKLFWGSGNGGFSDGPNFDTGTENVVDAVGGDFDADGIRDLFVLNYWDHNVGFMRGTGSGAFTSQVTMSDAPYPLVGRAVDINRDGRLDLVTSNAGADYITVLLGRGDGTFASAVTVKSGGDNTRTIDVADFNGDGKPDIVTQCESSRSVTVLINNTP